MGGGWHVEGLGGGKEALGGLTTVWDGEVVGMRGDYNRHLDVCCFLGSGGGCLSSMLSGV